ncbi:hypothetical protein [Paraburkholderia solisilvae]|uniref:Uncharacterized protein n=1 Tax=Paraburkholderia solisilvae TaxID=624376 RepID=A0A6J5DRC6_9BURK|nr:hypothetical protein [Paraburkholderia solisilvae]CAB3756850.1 hypothetical protein LMG29739_02554 [Paraburkholderia solisilvae]
MVPHIPAIAVTIPEVQPATPSFDAAGAAPYPLGDPLSGPPVASADARRSAFTDDAASRSVAWIERAEEGSRASTENLDQEVQRVLGGALKPADVFRLRTHINMNAEALQLYKKVADHFTNGVQTLARGN